ncbi:transposase IS200-family protein [Scytonema sp. HK-05]|uniref:IS200/IS605 family transposase n=2 Tax=Scytonema sp. HK-05 TaxID=1137095 RepID=UPI000AE3A33B|nr:IS200/IS605 family transposase [Scytonema sp. HK-05]BAY47297.1 transposase IS200-family protein [Scytonema sp. HK-05]
MRLYLVNMQARKASHSVFSVRLHFVFVTHYRRKALNAKMLDRLKEMVEQVSNKMDCQLIEFNGESDHVHILLDFHPRNSIAAVVGSLKSSTTRMLKKEFPEEVKKYYWGKVSFWSNSYYVSSCGGAPIEVLKKYIQNQARR